MQAVITTTLYLISILIPLTFTTINYELFEFPKFILLISGTLVIISAWIFDLIQNHNSVTTITKSKILTSPISISVIAILIIQTISTLFSISPYTSFWGYYSRFHGGLLTTICYTIIYFASVRWLDTKSTQKIIKIAVVTAFLISLYAILEHFGIDKKFWLQDVQSRVFSTLGQPNWLAAYLIPNIFLALYLAHTNKNGMSLFSHVIFTTLFIALLFTKSRSGIIGFGLSFITYWLVLARQFSFEKIKSNLYVYTAIAIAAIVIVGTPFNRPLARLITPTPPVTTAPSPTGTALETGGTESGDIRKIVWTGAIELVKKYPLLGTGPETFAYTYYWVRPVAHNMTSEWDFLYNKAHNEYLNIAATTGILGLLSYLAFHLSIFISSLALIPKTKKISQNNDDCLRHLYPVVGASIIGFSVTNFFGFSVIPVYLMMILIAALPLTIGHASPKQLSGTPYTIYFVIPIVLLYPAYLFLADMSFTKGKRFFDAGQIASALPLLKKASVSRPSEGLYHATLGEAYASAGQKDLALKEVDATRNLNPYHLNFYKSRAKTYLTLASVDPSYHNGAATELEKARQLAPTDPKLAYNLGLVYTRLDKPDLAIKQIQDAINLKPNYAEPYYALTLLYEQSKQIDKIKPLLTSAKANLATYSATLKEKIEKYITN